MSEKIQIGFITVGENRIERENSEYARWYRYILITPGVYPLMAEVEPNGEVKSVSYDLPGVVVGSNFQSCYGGVPIGDGGIDEEVGKLHVYHSWTNWIYTIGPALIDGTVTDIQLCIKWRPYKWHSGYHGAVLENGLHGEDPTKPLFLGGIVRVGSVADEEAKAKEARPAPVVGLPHVLYPERSEGAGWAWSPKGGVLPRR